MVRKIIRVDMCDERSIQLSEVEKIGLENQGYTLINTIQTGFDTFKMIYIGNEKCLRILTK